jgi:hypothetical protein
MPTQKALDEFPVREQFTEQQGLPQVLQEEGANGRGGHRRDPLQARRGAHEGGRMTTIVRNGKTIVVSWHCTPALFLATEEGRCGCAECRSPMGTGKTEDTAVADLLEQIEEAA